MKIKKGKAEKLLENKERVFSMAATHKGAISFGLVHIPVALYTATQDDDIHFNQLCKEDGSRIKYKKVCSHCGKEVSSGDIVSSIRLSIFSFRAIKSFTSCSAL